MVEHYSCVQLASSYHMMLHNPAKQLYKRFSGVNHLVTKLRHAWRLWSHSHFLPTSMTMMAGCRQSCVSGFLGRHAALVLLFFALLLEFRVIAEENGANSEEKVDDRPKDSLQTENGILVFSHGTFVAFST
jgi:hypothetical protein